MKQTLYMLGAIGLCLLMLPVLFATCIWNWAWDGLDTFMLCWRECEKEAGRK